VPEADLAPKVEHAETGQTLHEIAGLSQQEASERLMNQLQEEGLVIEIDDRLQVVPEV